VSSKRNRTETNKQNRRLIKRKIKNEDYEELTIKNKKIKSGYYL
jgi:predicted DNA-binding protein (MmcQ/YjbR family)